MAVKYVVTLTAEERQQLSELVTKGRAAAAKLIHARILLKADASPGGPNWTDAQIAQALDVSPATIHRVRQAFVTQGLDDALQRRRPTGRTFRKLDGTQEAQLIAVACSEPPAGRARWTLKLLADRLVELEVVDAISPECVRTTLKKNALKPWRKEQWVIPPKANAEFVCAMEDVLEVYHRPYDPKKPQVCLNSSTHKGKYDSVVSSAEVSALSSNSSRIQHFPLCVELFRRGQQATGSGNTRARTDGTRAADA